jgi:hypothetical protein
MKYSVFFWSQDNNLEGQHDDKGLLMRLCNYVKSEITQKWIFIKVEEEIWFHIYEFLFFSFGFAETTLQTK